MPKPEPAPRVRRRLGRALGAAAVTGLALGVLEGAIYPSVDGPRVNLFLYWAVLAFIMWRLQPDRYGVALFPVALVVQDAVSLLVQGLNPLTADWYAAVFGVNVLTRHDLGVPNWYWAAAAASLVLAVAVGGVDAWKAWRGKPKPRRRAAKT